MATFPWNRSVNVNVRVPLRFVQYIEVHILNIRGPLDAWTCGMSLPRICADCATREG